MNQNDRKAQCDAVCKMLLSERRVFANIARACVEEVAGCSIERIDNECLPGEIEVDKAIVEPEGAAMKLASMNTESAGEDEGTVRFDMVSPLVVPKDGRRIGLVVNVETQAEFNPPYPIPKRGVYYGSRLISMQYGTRFAKAEYGKLEKVYSIWICTNPSQAAAYTLNQFSLTEKRLVGNMTYPREDYDLLTVTMLCLGNKSQEELKGVFKMLQLLLRDRRTPFAEKMGILEKEFAVRMTPRLEKGVSDMGHLADNFIEEGRIQGLSQGREQGTLSVALEMLRSRLALPVILQCTKLSESALRSLAQAHGLAVA